MKNLKGSIALFLFAAITGVANLQAADSKEEKKGKTQHAVPPAQYPSEEGTRNFTLGAAYTYWMPYQEGMIVAVGGGSTSTAGDVITPPTTAQSGFKVFGSTNCFHDGWVGRLEYTWFYNNQDKLHQNSLISGINYTPTFSNDSVSYTSIESAFGNQFNRIQASVDRSFFAGHYLAMRPWMGLLAAFEEQHLQYQGFFGGEGAFDYGHMSQRWRGIGPYVGSEATYFFAADWGLRVHSGLSMLLAEHMAKNRIYQVSASGLQSTINLSRNHFWNVEPMFEVGLSVCWEGNWTNWGLALDIGWDLQTYFNHNPFQGFYSGVGVYGTYSMQGLTVSATVSF